MVAQGLPIEARLRSMYVPHFHEIQDEQELRHLVAEVGSAQLVTTGPDGYPLATLLPIIWEGSTVMAHLARANTHWTHIDEGAQGSPALLVVSGPEAYVSPSWYASKSEHGRVVPTWNYSAVHLRGTARIHQDVDWLRTAVDALVARHEAHRPSPWSSADAPEAYIDGQLRAIVGVEITVEAVEGKAKLSQNRSVVDRQGVVEGLRREPSRGALEVAEAMARQL